MKTVFTDVTLLRGIIINQDADGFFGSCCGCSCTADDIRDTVLQYNTKGELI